MIDTRGRQGWVGRTMTGRARFDVCRSMKLLEHDELLVHSSCCGQPLLPPPLLPLQLPLVLLLGAVLLLGIALQPGQRPDQEPSVPDQEELHEVAMSAAAAASTSTSCPRVRASSDCRAPPISMKPTAIAAMCGNRFGTRARA
jgi:hypothetical protein